MAIVVTALTEFASGRWSTTKPGGARALQRALLALRATAKENEHAFVRGFVAATAQTIRYEVGPEHLLKMISANERLLREAAVDEFDLSEVRPVLKQMRATERRLAAKSKP